MRSSQLAYASAPPGPVAVGAGSRGGTGASPRPLSLELIEKLLKLATSVRLQNAHSRNWFTGMSPVAYAVNGLLPRAHYLCGAWWRYVTARVRASGNQTVDGTVSAARQAHALLRDEGGQQLIERTHQRRIAGELVRSERLDRLDADFLDVAGDDAGEGAAQIRGQLVHGLRAREAQPAHARMRPLEGSLELRPDREQPVEIVGIARLAAKFAHRVHAALHAARDLRRVVHDHGEAPHGVLAQGI